MAAHLPLLPASGAGFGGEVRGGKGVVPDWNARLARIAWFVGCGVAGLVFIGLSGCAGQGWQDGGQGLPAAANHAPASSVDAGKTGSNRSLTPELLYELLLANIAGQRGRNAVAMESLSRAAHLSRRPPHHRPSYRAGGAA